MTRLRLLSLSLLITALLLNGCSALRQTKAEVVQATPTAQPTTDVSAPIRAGDRIIAEGEVEPVAYSSVNFSIQGTVAEVFVKEGDTVTAGQALARLKESAKLQADVTAAEVELLSAQQALDKIIKDANVARANAQLAVAQASKKLDDEKKDRQSMAYKRANQSTIDTARAANIVAEDAYKQAEEKWQGYVAKDENDVNRAEVLAELAKARQERDRTRANLNFVEAYPDEFETAIAEGELVLAQAQYDKALRDYDMVKNGPNPDDVALAELRIENAKAQIEAAKAAPQDLELLSPMAGTVVTCDLKVGEQAGPSGGSILLADLSAFQVKTTDLTELSVINVKPGAAATVSFDALPDLEATGKVLRVNELGVDKQGDITYTVTIQLDQQDPRLRWKMTATVSFEAQ